MELGTKEAVAFAAGLGVAYVAFKLSGSQEQGAKKSPVRIPIPLVGAGYLSEPLSPDLNEKLKDPENFQGKMEDMILRVQAEIVLKLSEIDGKNFLVDRHERPNGEGGGITTVLSDSAVFEKAGVNVSVLRGDLRPELAKQMSSRGKELGPGPHRFFASGISSVLHPRNPKCPTMHFNYRYFEVTAADGKVCSWFGGGADLTPSYLYEEDAIHFHQTLKDGCDKFDSSFYKQFKVACDEYFVIKHRNECRGIGGIFFDDLVINNSRQATFEFISHMAKLVLPTYVPIVLRRKDLPYTMDQRNWQLLRRGRYVEFNLVYDRGTKFGLATKQARIESIFISMPLHARWEYRHEPASGSEEAKLLHVVRNPINWV
eukprot:m.18198 g.18198  ORF g.18198 m.18198 type:complete len:372 (+) comp6234_c0_seq1:145-1260(+)